MQAMKPNLRNLFMIFFTRDTSLRPLRKGILADLDINWLDFPLYQDRQQ
jgi:hypothetical protein